MLAWDSGEILKTVPMLSKWAYLAGPLSSWQGRFVYTRGMAQRILLVDDDASIIKALRGYLELGGFEVLEAGEGEAALSLARSVEPDLLILDLMLPGKDGFEVTRAIRADPVLSLTPILMLTARVDDVDKIVGLEIGADDYVTKPFNPREVVARVKALLRRSAARDLARRVLEAGDLVLDLDRRELFVKGEALCLTRTEFNILEALMRNPGYVMPRDQLLEKAMGYAYEGLGRTLDTHVRNLRKKIEADPENPAYVRTVYGIGYRFMGAER